MTNGARVIDSTPPAMANSISPLRIARAASPTALRPEAHSRLTVTPGNGVRQAGKQQRHARDIAVVLAGLVGAAEQHLVEPRPIDFGVARDQRPDRSSGEIVGANLGERAAVAADRGARCVADENLSHRYLLGPRIFAGLVVKVAGFGSIAQPGFSRACAFYLRAGIDSVKHQRRGAASLPT